MLAVSGLEISVGSWASSSNGFQIFLTMMHSKKSFHSNIVS